MTPNATPIGQTLIHLGLISKDQLHIALREQGRSGEILGGYGTHLADWVPKACQQKSRTVMWWYQCRKISGFLRRTMNTVSISSGT